MKKEIQSSVIPNSWDHLKEFTQARLALGRCGVSLPSSEQLAFQLSHAQARDAVHTALDFNRLKQELLELTNLPYPEKLLSLKSAAQDRREYLARPDLGRVLSDSSRKSLSQAQMALGVKDFDLSLVIADGLSSKAVQNNALPVLEALLPLLENWKLSPLSLLEQGRVACADEIAQLWGAKACVILLGERPGLSSPDSLGIYLTWHPQAGLSRDDKRNCISNVRPQGLGWQEAASKLAYLLEKARSLGLSGVALKDDQVYKPRLAAPEL